MPEIKRITKCIVLNAPEWFKRKDFADYVVNHANALSGQRCPTFHVGWRVNEYSDIFVNVSGSGLEDVSEDLPEDICETLHDIANEDGDNGAALFWIQNIS